MEEMVLSNDDNENTRRMILMKVAKILNTYD